MEELKGNYSELPGIEFSFPVEDFWSFYSTDGLKLHTYKYPAKDIRCLAFCFHGLHGYSNTHAVTAKYLSDIGCEVLAFDHRGHGKSQGTRALIPSFDVLVRDCIKFINEISSQYSQLPIFLMGGSMGACLCIHINNLLPSRFKGIILMSPALSSHSNFEGLGYCLLSSFSFCCPRMLLTQPNPREYLSNQLVIDYVTENPYIYTGRIRIGTLTSVLNGMRRAKSMATSTNTPFVIVHGTNDRVVDPKASQRFYLSAPALDKSLWLYSGLPHAIGFEKKIYEISERLQNWVLERITYASSIIEPRPPMPIQPTKH